MALLTADDVLNKKFQAVKFREGYDQIEVDEFLDEVVATIYNLTVENGELREQLAAAQAQVEALSAGEAPAAVVQVDTVVEEAPIPEPIEPVVQVEEPAPEPTLPADDGPAAASSMLVLAQRLHDEYVADGQAEAERIVSEAKAESESIVGGANAKRDEILAQLADEQKGLEESINHLREFESDYRKAISEYLEDLLGQMKAGSVE